MCVCVCSWIDFKRSMWATSIGLQISARNRCHYRKIINYFKWYSSLVSQSILPIDWSIIIASFTPRTAHIIAWFVSSSRVIHFVFICSRGAVHALKHTNKSRCENLWIFQHISVLRFNGLDSWVESHMNGIANDYGLHLQVMLLLEEELYWFNKNLPSIQRIIVLRAK